MESSDSDSQNSISRCSDPGTDSSDSEVEEICDDLDISVKEAQENFSAVGNLIPEESPVNSLTDFKSLYPEAFTTESEAVLKAVLEDIQLPYQISPFQETAVNGLLNGLDLVCIVPTGSGKMLVIYLFAMAIRKLPNGYRGLPNTNKSLVLAGMPLTLIMKQQLENSLCPVAMLTMDGQMFDSTGKVVTNEKFVSGHFSVLFTHPEALSTDGGRSRLRVLRKEKMLFGLIQDEFHQGQEDHWGSFRVRMLEAFFDAQAHMVHGSPLGALSATATHSEVDQVIACFGRRKKPAIKICEGPILPHHKICIVRRPSSQVPLLGKSMTIHGKITKRLGLLDLLRRIALDEFLNCVKMEQLQQFKKTVILFRTAEHMAWIHAWLAKQTGVQVCDSAPFVMIHSKIGESDDDVMEARREDIKLYLVTNRFLLGVDISSISVIIIVRPPNMAHTIVQAMGRSGRRSSVHPGLRPMSITYLLYNASDLAVKGISEDVKQICASSDMCSRQLLRKLFVGEYTDTIQEGGVHCCRSCDRKRLLYS